MLIAILGGSLLAGFGLFQMVKPDLAWRLHAHWRRQEGAKPERTPEWERMRVVVAVFQLLFGVGIALYGFAQQGAEHGDRSSLAPSTGGTTYHVPGAAEEEAPPPPGR